MNLFCVSESNCSIGRILLVVRIGHRAIIVAAGEQGDFPTELAHDDFSHSPPQGNRLGAGPRKPASRYRISGQYRCLLLPC